MTQSYRVMTLLRPKYLLHLEGFLVLVAAGASYGHFHYSWWKFAALFLIPDLAMIGYFAGPKVGALFYNLGHTYLSVAIAGAAGLMVHWHPVLPVCLIWLAHIGFDRGLGYGLKYPTAFKDTHLARV